MKEKLEQIRIDLVDAYDSINRGIDTVDLALQHFENQGITNVSISRDSTGKITTVWEGETEKLFDIQFKNDKVDKWHSFRWMLNNEYTPPPLPETDTEHSFTINPEWGVEVRFVIGEWYEDRNEFVIDDIVVSTPLPAIKAPKIKLWGFYDGYLVPDDIPVTLYKTDLSDSNIEKRIDMGQKIVLMISGFPKNGEDWKIKQRWKNQAHPSILTDKIRDAIAFVYVMDEPWHKGYDVEYQEKAVKFGREIFGDFKYGFSHMGDHAMNPGKVLARNVDFVGVNNYPFYHPEWAALYNDPIYHVNSKEDFFRFENQLLDRIREKVPDTPILLTGQSFYMEQQYRKPPIESPQWYAELISANEDILGVMWYVWEGRKNNDGSQKEFGLKHIPDLYEAHKVAFE